MAAAIPDLVPGTNYEVSGLVVELRENPKGSGYQLVFGKRVRPVTRIRRIGGAIEISYGLKGNIRRSVITPSPLK